MRIGEAASTSGVSARALRFYEDEGLITPGRCGNGYRDYCTSTLDRVEAVRALLDAGLPVRLVRDLLPHLADGGLCPELRDGIQDYRDRLAARIATLDARRAALDDFLGRA